jgi:hypothetical protein
MAQQQRFTLLLDGPTADVLDEIQSATRLRSRAAVFDLAVNILDWFVDQKRKGMEVGRFNVATGKFDELLLPVNIQPVAPPVADPKVPQQSTNHLEQMIA